jgi:hypothetical protein
MLTITILLTIVCVFFAYYCIKFALVILRMQEKIESALDKIDLKYNRLGQILDIPVFYDSPEIKNIIIEVQEVQDVVLSLAEDLSNATKSKDSVEDEIG